MNPAHLPLGKQLPHLRKTLSTNGTLLQVLSLAQKLALPNWYLAGGAVSQTIWNSVSGLPAETGISDYDLVYFDASDTSYEAEDAAIRRGRNAGIDSWISTSAMIGVRLEAGGEWSVYAPRGLSDFYGMVVRPNPMIGNRHAYEKKARRWLGIWKGLTVMPWPENQTPLTFEKDE
ncbi:hypothetical protein CH063_14716 [Colletotrichum higginsianum]|uniref:Nucleotidyltransferase family protein n=1 Tax=Colletotrichum higginsianum (strain IMI 349063) TaxID=759273 RepID=H1VZT4_COLHI|nr:hypothetical protein CH063_14716 [Colletotrichum higginsianum]